jgi:glycosyltransferase involved in cell wall biosynthesis
MDEIKIAYEGPFFDYSGYGEANRQALAALYHSGVKVKAKKLHYTSQSTDYGDVVNIINECLSNDFDYKLKIMHVTPDELPRLVEKGKYNISHFFWETDRLPKIFVDGLNSVDEIWTGSRANFDAIVNSGVTKPVYIFPQATNTSPIKTESLDIEFDGFIFYSIFEWTDRKNPEALIKAYNNAFNGEDDVALMIKSYITDFSRISRDMISSKIINLQDQYDHKNKIFLYHKLITYEQIHGFHERGDCYVSAHRGEGWGVPQAEALCHGNPVISTGYGGINEYITNMVDGIVIPYTMVGLTGMDHSRRYYSFDQKWAEIDIDDLSEKIRFMYDNRDLAQAIGNKGKNLAHSQFSYQQVGALMKTRIMEILG